MPPRKPPRKAKPKSEPRSEPQLPMFEDPPGASELRVLPHELRPGDVVRDALGEGTVSHVPAVYREGKRVSVRLPSGEERVLDFASHEKVPVRRPGPPPSGA